MVRVTDRFYIDANPNCYTLKEKAIVQDKNSKNYGQETYKDLGYYVSLESLLKGIVKTVTREYIAKNDTEINDLIKEIKRQEEFIESLNLKI